MKFNLFGIAVHYSRVFKASKVPDLLLYASVEALCKKNPLKPTRSSLISKIQFHEDALDLLKSGINSSNQ